MGITRWTQDLTPYLETAMITKSHDHDNGIVIRAIIIDGPSMVYHVYSALAASNHAAPGCFTVPTYRQLSTAIDVFLMDLESCGAKIEFIFFDGALPISKRSTRLDRLEKSRLQLEQVRRLELIPAPSILQQDLDRKQLSKILWQSRFGSVRSTSLTAPFIVPCAIEYLRSSKWSTSVSVVPGEAETFCASAAKKTGAAVLSNDSDLTLLADMQDGGVVGMLHSLSVSQLPDEEPTAINLQCWRPEQVKKRLNTQDLRLVAFERSKDATASFATTLQRSAKRHTKEEASALARFLEQYKPPNGATPTTGTKFELKLNNLDPRLAELICQLHQAKETSSNLRDQELWVTLPVLFEDPSKDASWTYGREIRRLAYSLLFASCGQSHGDKPQTITESIRKGQRITQDVVEVLHPSMDKIGPAIKGCIADLASLSETVGSPREYILWALASVLKQRTAMGKGIMPSVTTREYLGLRTTHHPSTASKKVRSLQPDPEAQWRLLHLNANVQSVLYSLRMLCQTCILLKDSLLATSYEADFMRLLKLIDSMPPIQDLFLDADGVGVIMRKAPLSREDRVYKDIFADEGSTSQLTHRANVKKENVGVVPMEDVVRKKRKKQTKSASDDTGGRGDKPRPHSSGKFSKNPFDLLMEA